jgi:predicted O-methyltransferase YrrM
MITQTQNPTDDVLQQIQEIGNREFLPIIGPLRGKLLVEEIRKAKPRHVLEVGTLIGYSAILMAKELDAHAELVSIEIHQDEAELALLNIQRAQLKAKIEIVIGNALDVIPTLRGPFEFVFLDAEKSEYRKYLELVEPKLAAGAVVFADNAGVFADAMANYLDYVRSSGKYRSRYVQVGDDGVEISTKL